MSRARTAGLVVSLVVLSLLLGSLSTGDTSPLSVVVRGLPNLSPPPPSPPVPPATGELLVNASVVRGARGASPAANATVTIKAERVGFSPFVFVTNSSGEVEVQEEVGNYTVAVSSRYYSYSAVVEVEKNVTAVANFIFTEAVDQTIFLDLSNSDSSGYVAPWQSVIMAVNGTSAVTNGSEYFIDAFGPGSDNSTTSVSIVGALTGDAGPDSSVEFARLVQEVPVSIVASRVTGSGDSSLLWLTVRPEQLLTAAGDLLYTLGTYAGAARITYLGQ